MREVDVKEITHVVREMVVEANYHLGDDVLDAFDSAIAEETSPVGAGVLNELKENAAIAAENVYPMCQDTGFAVIFVDLGQDVHLVGGGYIEAIQEGVRQGYASGYLRKSICDPFSRQNTGDNTPAVIHTEIVPGDSVKIICVPKGGGSENMSTVTMLSPSAGKEGIKDFIVRHVEKAGANPCPPVVVGVGIGGTLEKAAMLAKRALLRPVGNPNRDLDLAAMEQDILTRVNALGIGPAGYGGRTTALAVHIEKHPCHIASLPLAVNINCHAARHKEAVL